MNTNQEIYDLKRADRVCIGIILIVCIIILISNFLGAPFQKAIGASAPIGAAVVLIFVLYFIPISSKIKGFIYSLIILAGTIVSLLNDPTDQTAQFNLAASMVILSLYYSKKLILSYAAVLNASYILMYVMNDVLLFGTHRPVNYLISTLVVINGIFVIILFVNKWGSEVIQKAFVKEKEATALFEKLQVTLAQVEEYSEILNTQVAQLNKNMSGIVTSSKETTATMNDIAEGSSKQAGNMNDMNANMIKVLDQVNETQKISDKMSSNSGTISSEIEEGTKQISLMFQQMDTIQYAVSAAITTVNTLQYNVVEINKFLGGIVSIANQTNMLSLNASIEAARAGVHGQGFVVVAKQIGLLASQTSELVKSITEITKTISVNSGQAVDKVNQGEVAVESGNLVLTQVSNCFNEMKYSVNETLELLKTEGNMLQGTLHEFTSLQVHLEEISSISEQNAASNQEIYATLEHENVQIEAIQQASYELGQISLKLKEMLQEM